MNKFTILSIVICVALLAATIHIADPASLAIAWQKVTWVHLLIAFVAVQLQIVASAYRWKFTASRLGHKIETSVAIREYYLSSALNLLLPGGIAGDAIRAYRSRTDESGGWKRPSAAVFLERLSGQLAFFALCCLGLLAWPRLLQQRLPSGDSEFIWIITAVIATGIGVGIAFRKAWIPRRIREVGPELHAVFIDSGAWLVQIGLSVLVIGGYLSTFLIASDGVGAPLPAMAAITIIPLCLLTMLIPAGIGGWGTREAAAAALWPLFGYSAAEGLAASLVYGVISLLGAALPGLIAIAITLLQVKINKANA